MQAQLRVLLAGVRHQPRVGHDDGIHAQRGGGVYGAVPGLYPVGLRVGIERQQHLAPALVRVGYARGNGGSVKVQTCKIAGVGGISETQIHAVCTVINRCFERGQATCRADKLGRRARGCGRTGRW